MTSFHDLATELSRAFETRTRDNGEEFTCLKDGSPEWMSDLVQEAHGDFLADDWRYKFIERAADHFAETDSDPDEFGEAADSAVDVYNARLTDWLSSNVNRVGYVDEAVEEFGGKSDGIIKSIMLGQYAEISEVFGMVASALTELATDDDETDDETESRFGNQTFGQDAS